MTNTLPSIPNYTITEPIKEIPVGCVARAQSHMDGSEHCCVIIRYTDMVPANYTRLMSLVSIVSEMRHPNICTLREYVLNVDEKVLCIIVEDYPGRSLLDLVRGNIFLYNFDPWEITRIGIAILDALEYLHNPFTTGGSIVHLGVSLEHIYVTPTGVPMLSILPLFWSLGLNKIVNYAPDLTLYRSPQILRSTPFSSLADIWSLGLVLYFLLQGEVLLTNDNVSSIVFRADFPVFTITGPAPLQTTLTHMLSKDEDSRVTARELLRYKPFLDLDENSIEQTLSLPFPRQHITAPSVQSQSASLLVSSKQQSAQRGRDTQTTSRTPAMFMQEGRVRSNLIDAVVAGDTARFKELVSLESTLVDDVGRTALMYAAFLGNYAMAKRLLKLECRRRDHHGCTALYYAARGGHKSIVSLLLPLEKGIYCLHGLTAYNLLIKEHDFQAAKLLVAAESPCRTELGLTALMVAATDNDIEAVEFLLNYEANQKDKYGWTALMYAIKSNSCYVLQQLVASENNTFTADGVTPLMISASVNNVPALTALIPLQSGKTDTRGRTALMYGAMKGSVEATELMVQGTQELGAQDTMGFTSLMYAAVNNAVALLPTLLSGERCKRDREGKTALMHAAIAGNAECVKLLLLSETGAIDNDDYTALMRAVEKGHREVVDLLLEAEGGILTTRGTALMIAAEVGDLYSVLHLIPQEAKMQRKSGECACMLALQANNLSVAKELLVHEVHLHNKDGKGVGYYATTTEAKLLVEGYRGRVNIEGAAKHIFG